MHSYGEKTASQLSLQGIKSSSKYFKQGPSAPLLSGCTGSLSVWGWVQPCLEMGEDSLMPEVGAREEVALKGNLECSYQKGTDAQRVSTGTQTELMVSGQHSSSSLARAEPRES